jgi:hypothetical protein
MRPPMGMSLNQAETDRNHRDIGPRTKNQPLFGNAGERASLGKKRSPAGRSNKHAKSREETDEIPHDPILQDRLASAGREGPSSRVEIIDEVGSVLASGERGETRPSSGHHREEIDATKSLGQECNKVDGRQCADGRSSVRRRRSVPRPAPFACAPALSILGWRSVDVRSKLRSLRLAGTLTGCSHV